MGTSTEMKAGTPKDTFFQCTSPRPDWPYETRELRLVRKAGSSPTRYQGQRPSRHQRAQARDDQERVKIRCHISTWPRIDALFQSLAGKQRIWMRVTEISIRCEMVGRIDHQEPLVNHAFKFRNEGMVPYETYFSGFFVLIDTSPHRPSFLLWLTDSEMSGTGYPRSPARRRAFSPYPTNPILHLVMESLTQKESEAVLLVNFDGKR